MIYLIFILLDIDRMAPYALRKFSDGSFLIIIVYCMSKYNVDPDRIICTVSEAKHRVNYDIF